MADGDLTLVYQASLTTTDNLSSSVFSYYQPITKTLATLTKGGALQNIFLHFNNNILVQRGTRDVGQYYAVRRKWRSWVSNLDPNDLDTQLDEYAIDAAAPLLDSGDKPVGRWTDAPGQLLATRYPLRQRLLSEWIVGGVTSYNTLVEGLGGLYFFVVLDLTPTLYRMSMSPSFDVTADQVADTLGRSGDPGPLPLDSPWKTQDDIADADWLARHTTWQDYSALNQQLPAPAP